MVFIPAPDVSFPQGGGQGGIELSQDLLGGMLREQARNIEQHQQKRPFGSLRSVPFDAEQVLEIGFSIEGILTR